LEVWTSRRPTCLNMTSTETTNKQLLETLLQAIMNMSENMSKMPSKLDNKLDKLDTLGQARHGQCHHCSHQATCWGWLRPWWGEAAVSQSCPFLKSKEMWPLCRWTISRRHPHLQLPGTHFTTTTTDGQNRQLPVSLVTSDFQLFTTWKAKNHGKQGLFHATYSHHFLVPRSKTSVISY